MGGLSLYWSLCVIVQSINISRLRAFLSVRILAVVHYTLGALADGFLCSRDGKAGKKPNLISRILTRNREKEFMLDLHKPTAKFSLCDISIPVSTDGELATHRTREIAPNRRPSTNNAIEIGHLDY